ncbi:MAG TPA: phosphoserine phosphatase SerB [Trebonia sp.]|jgi:phosphoserine phosphatase|nr:phosphoserine phosphatase SerB [Trebonia sp.]
MNHSRTTLLITLTGRDRPGVTARLFGALARFPLSVADIEQVTIRGRLVLGVLVSCTERPDLTAIYQVVSDLAADLGLEAEITTGSAESPARAGSGRVRGRLHVTVLGSPLQPSAVAAVAGAVASSGANIDRITRLASDPVTCVELDVSGADPVPLRNTLAQVAVDSGVDVAVQRAGLERRAMRLIVMDVDSTLIQDEVIDLLADRAGCAAEVAAVTESAMRGELDFAASLRERVALLKGLDAGVLDEVRSALRLTPGARTLIRTLKRLGYRCGIVSGGFTLVIAPLADELGIDYVAANTLEIAAGKLTGEVVEPIIDREGKTEALRTFARAAGVPLSQTVAVGDGANDLGMIGAAGLGVAFNAKPVVRDAADTAVNVPYLDTILYLLGIPRDAVDAADQAAE